MLIAVSKNLSPNNVITLTDYPVHSKSKLEEYIEKCKVSSLPLVPVIRKAIVKQYFDSELLEVFERFEKEHPDAEYFMLDGSHRTTALCLSNKKIEIIIYETDEDIIQARNNPRVLENETLDWSLERNCQELCKHFKKTPRFMTVEEKTDRMVDDELV